MDLPFARHSVHKAVDTISGHASTLHDEVCHPLVDSLQGCQCIALNLNGAAVLPFPADGGEITFDHLRDKPKGSRLKQSQRQRRVLTVMTFD